MERPPYNLCGGQNRVQIIITSTRETPLFSLGKNTQKNKEFEHNRCKEYCMYVLVWEYLKKNLSRTNLPRSSSNFFIDGIVPSAVLDGFQVPAKEKRGTRGK